MSFPYLTDAVNAMLGTRWHLPIPTFGVLVMVAILTASRVLSAEVRRRESLGALPALTHTLIADLVMISVIAGLIGARIFHILEYPGQFIADPGTMIFTRSGFSIYGGLCLGVIAGVIFLRRHAIPIIPMLDSVCPALMLGYCIGRLGCQFSGDADWGIAADMAAKPAWVPDWMWAQTYDGNIAGIALPSPGVYPTPLYESAMALALFGALWALRSQRHQAGFLFSIYLLFAGFERLLIEKIRINADYHLFGMVFTQAEAISFVLILAGLAGLLLTVKTRRIWIRSAIIVSGIAALSACVRL